MFDCHDERKEVVSRRGKIKEKTMWVREEEEQSVLVGCVRRDDAGLI